jgi:hypothetical protein
VTERDMENLAALVDELVTLYVRRRRHPSVG